jgi:hypothetical protein
MQCFLATFTDLFVSLFLCCLTCHEWEKARKQRACSRRIDYSDLRFYDFIWLYLFRENFIPISCLGSLWKSLRISLQIFYSDFLFRSFFRKFLQILLFHFLFRNLSTFCFLINTHSFPIIKPKQYLLIAWSATTYLIPSTHSWIIKSHSL